MVTCIILTCLFTATVFAAQYIYYDGGLKDGWVEVEDRLDYDVFHSSIAEWNNASPYINIQQVPGSGHSYIISGQWQDTWYGTYTPQEREFVFWGRAGKFKIELNRTNLVSESDTFRKSVLVHELGHAFCLDDNPSSGNSSVMNHTRDRNFLTWPTRDDIAGVKSAYTK